MSMRVVILTGALVLAFLSLSAQEKWNYAEVDKQSYALFQEGKWSELLRYTEESRNQGIDFFYLQVRTGIAEYNLGKFRDASGWFLRTYDSDPSIDWLQEYLYYSLLYSGRELEANKFAVHFTEDLKMKIKYKQTGITHLGYEGGYSFNSEFDQIKNLDFASELQSGTDYGEAYFLKNYNFHSLDLSHRVSPSLVLIHNFTYVGVNREASIDWTERNSSPVRINQFSYFINPVWVVGKKLNVSSSLNLTFGNTDFYIGSLNSDLTMSYYNYKSTYSDYVFSTAIWSEFGNFTPGIEGNAGNINNSKIYQLSSWITWYPLSNTKVYFKPQVYFKSGDGETGVQWSALGLSGGVKMGPIYFSGLYLFGSMENFVESGGYIITNFDGKSDWKMMGSLYFPIGKKYQFVMRYIRQNMIEKYQVYTDDVESNVIDYNYLKTTLTGGISWNF